MQMEADHVARASVTVAAPRDKVWQALVDPEAIREYMFGTDVASDWTEGSEITWKGVWEGRPYADRGVIKQVLPGTRLHYSHYSPLGGKPDVPENYHNVTIDLTDLGEETRVYLSQDGNPTEAAKMHSEKNWEVMLGGLKAYVETHATAGARERRAEAGAPAALRR
jgi:uncharacterized protein YndB with AHSA1/START domain